MRFTDRSGPPLLPFFANAGPVLFTKQTGGPNMSGNPSCGMVGRP